MAINRYERYYPIPGAVASDNRSDRTPNTLTVSIAYHKGGMNVFSYKNEPRGIYLHIAPEFKQGVMTMTVPTEGVKTCLEESGRFSKKLFERHVRLMDHYINQYVNPFCINRKIEIEPSFTEAYYERAV